MFNEVLLVALSVWTGAFSKNDPVPEYSHARYLYQKAMWQAGEFVKVSDLSEYNIPSPKRDYAILLAVLDDITNRMSESCFGNVFEDFYYDVVNETVPEAWTQPAVALAGFKSLAETVKDVTKPVIDLISRFCAPITLRSSKDSIDCDIIVDLTTRLDPEKYQKPAKVLLAAAKAGKIYLADPLWKVADRNEVIHFLLTDKESLRSLAKAVANVKRLLR